MKDMLTTKALTIDEILENSGCILKDKYALLEATLAVLPENCPYCPSCLNNELENANNWCDDFRSQMSFNKALDEVRDAITKLFGI